MGIVSSLGGGKHKEMSTVFFALMYFSIPACPQCAQQYCLLFFLTTSWTASGIPGISVLDKHLKCTLFEEKTFCIQVII